MKRGAHVMALLVVLSTVSPSAASNSGCAVPSGRDRPPDGIRVQLSLSQRVISVGEPLRITITVRNRGREPVDYWWGQPPADFWIKGPGGVIWRWTRSLPSNSAFTGELNHTTLEPGEERRDAVTWRHLDCDREKLALPAGTYVARAAWTASRTMNGSGRWWSPPVEFEIA